MPAFLDTLGSIPLAIAAVALLIAAAWGTGGWVIPSVDISRRQQWESELLRIVVGLNLIGFVGIVLGMTGVLSGGRSVWLLIGLAFSNWIVDTRQRWMKRLPAWPALKRQRPSWGDVAFGILAFVTLGPALCYPTGWDEMVYHGVLPRRWLVDGYPAVYRDLPYSGFPSFGEMLFWLIAPMEALIAPRLIIWVGWMLGLLLLTALLRRFGAGRSASLITCCFAASPAVLIISANCYVESLLMMNVAALLLGAVHFRHRRGTLVLGVLAGGATAMKLTGLAVLALPVLWSLGMVHYSSQRHSGKAAVHAAFATMVAIAFGLPFYLRPWWATANPCFPFFAAWFTTSPETLAMSQFHHTIGDLGFGVRSVESFFATPVLLGFQDQLYDGGFGWQWLLVLALSAWAMVTVVRHRKYRRVLWPAGAAASLYVAWYFTSQQGRFAVPMALATVCIAAVGLRRFSPQRRKLILGGLTVATTISLPWPTGSYYAASWETIAGRWTWAEGLDDATRGKYVPLLAAIEQQTPQDAQLLLVLEHRLLYMPRTTFIGTPFFQDRWLMPPRAFVTDAPLIRHLREGGITHLVIAKAPIGPDWSPDFWERSQSIFQGIATALQSEQLRIVWESEDHLLMEIPSISADKR